MNRAIPSILVAVSFLAARSTLADTIVVTVSGTFDDRLMQDTTNGLEYPFPSIFNGSFSGSFSMSSAATRCDERVEHYRIFDVQISVFANDGSLIQTIEDYPVAEFREFNRNKGIAYIGKSSEIANQLQDLRLTFDYETTPGDGMLALEAFLDAKPRSGFIETDAASQRSGFEGWNVRVDSFTADVDVSPSVDEPASCNVPDEVVPEPKSLSGCLLLLAIACHAIRQPRQRVRRNRA